MLTLALQPPIATLPQKESMDAHSKISTVLEVVGELHVRGPSSNHLGSHEDQMQGGYKEVLLLQNDESVSLHQIP